MSKKAGSEKQDRETGRQGEEEKGKPPAAKSPATEQPSDSETQDENRPPAAKKEKTFSKAELEAEKQKAIAEAKKKWDEEKELTELELLKKQNAELLAGMRLRDAKEEVVAALAAAGNKSPELAFQALKAELKFDDAGKLINTKALIEGLKTNYPEQFGEAKPGETIDGGAGQEGKGEKLTAEKLAAMTPDEINKLDWNEVKAVMETAK